MTRRRTAAAEPVEAPPATSGPHRIDPNAVYVLDEARQLFHLRKSSIRREVREGRLRIAKRCGRYYLLGAWLLEWLQGGEIARRS